MVKPIIPNNFNINEEITIVKRCDENEYVDVYNIKTGDFLYLLKKNVDIINKKLNIIDIKITNKIYKGIILNEFKTPQDILSEIKSAKGFSAVAGMQKLKNILLNDVINPIKNKEKYDRFKLSIPNGILLYGPPGCGKTYIVKKLAEEIGYSYIDIKHSDISSPFIHGSVGKISDVFKKAQSQLPCIVFIDEIDGIAPRRSDLTSSSFYKMEEINELLMQLNDAGKKNILIIGATNKIELIDDAVLRPGRFDKKIYVYPPDFEARMELFKMYLDLRPCFEIKYDILARYTDGYSCSDIEYICNEAARVTIALEKDKIDTRIVMDVISVTKSSISDILETDEPIDYIKQ